MTSKSRNTVWVGCISLICAGALAACDTDELENKIDDIDSDDVKAETKNLAKQCGLECPALGIVDGNAAISGVTSVDAFFGAVIDYNATAASVSSGMEAQLDAIRADFDIAADADVSAEIALRSGKYIDGAVRLEMEPAQCTTDVQAVVQALAACDTQFEAKEKSCGCRGRCISKSSASIECESSAELTCTVSAPSIECDTECQGSCQVELKTAAKCEGTCSGECSGECSAYRTNSEGDYVCAGQCDGMCQGSCSTELSAAAKCEGKCEGQCIVSGGSAMCTSAISTSCKSKSETVVMCKDRCDGEVVPPEAKAECVASAKARAEVHVECTPPRLALHYKLAAVAAGEVKAQASFVVALHRLEKRLPALVAARAKAERVVNAGVMLTASAKSAVKDSFNEAKSGKISVKEAIGLGCAIGELEDVEEAVNKSAERLDENVDECNSIEAMLGANG